MGNVFSQKPLKEVIRENQRMVKKAIRELEKEIRLLEASEKKLKADIQKGAKANQHGAIRIMAKDLVRTRKYVERFYQMKTHLSAVALKMQTIKSHEAMTSAMKGVTKAMTAMNKQVDMPGLQKIMQEFMTENEKSEMTQEMIGDTMDDAFSDETSEEQEEKIVSQVLAELGIGVSESVPSAPEAGMKANPVAETKESESAGLSELESRLRGL